MIKYEEVNKEFLIAVVLEYEEEILAEADWLGAFLPHCIFVDVLNSKFIGNYSFRIFMG